MQAVLNISAYKFTPFASDELPALRDRLLVLTRDELSLRGTILLSTEGINAFLAGPREAIAVFFEVVRSIRGLEDLTPKESLSEVPPFNRMLVKVKKEIIAFGVEGIDPARAPAPRLDPRTLKQWLDERRPITLLDTRNDYEVRLGTFENAVVPHIRTFREFPAAVASLPVELKSVPLVTFCTGGIRCEKAAPLLQREGFKQVFQLDGGILKYFELCGGHTTRVTALCSTTGWPWIPICGRRRRRCATSARCHLPKPIRPIPAMCPSGPVRIALVDGGGRSCGCPIPIPFLLGNLRWSLMGKPSFLRGLYRGSDGNEHGFLHFPPPGASSAEGT